MSFDKRFGQHVAGCEEKIGYDFFNRRLYAEALNAAGPGASLYRVDASYETLPKNDRLALYDDSVAAPVLCLPWYEGGSDKGTWTLIRKEALSNDSLADTGFGRGIDFHINKDDGTLTVSNKIIATAVEAILGAVRIDGGSAALARVMEQLRIVNPFDSLERLQMCP